MADVQMSSLIDPATGKLLIQVPNQNGVTFEQAKAAVKKVSDALGVGEIPFKFVTDVEKHTHKTHHVAVEDKVTFGHRR